MYTLDNNELTPNNLHLFYSTLDYLEAIPYNGVKITDTEYIWLWEYSGGWGLGYEGSLKYNIANKTYYLECYLDSTIFGILEGNELDNAIFENIGYSNLDEYYEEIFENYNKPYINALSAIEFIKTEYNIEWISNYKICVSTTDINKVVDVGYYYTFDYTESFSGTNVISTEESIKHSKEMIINNK